MGFTWWRPNSKIFSTIDAILYPGTKYKVEIFLDIWGLRLDPYLAKDPWTKDKVINGYNELIESIPQEWDPHMKLEFAKVCVRTVCENVQAEQKR